jgi:hypothetical protein
LAVLVASLVVGLAPSAKAACAALPADSYTFKEMIRHGSTNSDYFDLMMIGKVRAIRDPGAVGGRAVAILAVRAHPTGWTPLTARVRFYKQKPGSWVEDNVNFRLHDRFVVIAHHLADGSYRHDGGCGDTKRVAESRFESLLFLARTYD